MWSAVDLEVTRPCSLAHMEQVANDSYSVRVYFHFLSTFRLLDLQQHQLEHMQALIDNLTERVRQLEIALLAGTPLNVPARAVQVWSGPPASVWDDQVAVSQDMEPESEMPADATTDL